MQIIKQKRNYWRVEPGTTEMAYATVELTAAYDDAGVWSRGWHVRLRDPEGRITGLGGVHATAKNAAAAAIALLS